MSQPLDHLQSEQLTERANEALRLLTNRFHEVPARDLPDVAAKLLDLADRMKPKTGRQGGKSQPSVSDAA